VRYSVFSGPASVTGNKLKIFGAAPVVVQARQSGNSAFYAAAPVAVTIAVSQAPLTVAASNASRSYGTANPELHYSFTGFVNGDTSASLSGSASLTTTATSQSPTGTYPIAFSTSALVDPNYSFTYVNGALTVLQAPLSVVVNSVSKTYGAANPTFGGTLSGLLNGDVLTATYSSAATAASSVGLYPIAPAISGAAVNNYIVTVTPGTLEIDKVMLTVTGEQCH
jgi:hypothetical protein